MLNISKVKLFSIVLIASITLTALLVKTFDTSSERALINKMYQSGLSTPDWVEAITNKELNQGYTMVKYGLGGRTCTAILTIDSNGSISEESNKRCYG